MSKYVADSIKDIGLRRPRIHLICPVNDEKIYESILLASLKHNRYASLTKVVGAKSAAEAFNENIVNHPPDGISILVHQDVYFPPNWMDVMEGIFDNLKFGVAGCVGCSGWQLYADVYAGPTEYIDINASQLPARVDYLDELILIFPSNTKIRLDPDLGWHMYGADACVKAKKLGQNALVIKNRLVHYSKKAEIHPSFRQSAIIFRDKNPGPISTTIIRIDGYGNIIYL